MSYSIEDVYASFVLPLLAHVWDLSAGMPSPLLAQVFISTVSIASSLGIGIKNRQIPESKPTWDLLLHY